MLNVSILVTKGFLRKSGYYHRVMNDYFSLIHLGYHPIIYIIAKVNEDYNDNVKFCFISFNNIISIIRNINKSTLIISENYVSALILFIAKALSIINNAIVSWVVVHGSLEEIENNCIGKLKKQVLTFSQKYIFLQNDLIICVSNKMKEIFDKLTWSRKCNYIVMPNVPSKDFIIKIKELENCDLNRKEYLLPEASIIFTFVGGSQKWQNIEFILSLYDEINKINKSAFFLFISNDILDIENMIINNSSLPSFCYRLISLDNKQIPEYLLLSDFLVVIRREDEINRVACPTKLVEYLFAKKKIIISDNLGDFSDLINDNELGYIINNNKSLIALATEIIDYHGCTIKQKESMYLSNYEFENKLNKLNNLLKPFADY